MSTQLATVKKRRAPIRYVNMRATPRRRTINPRYAIRPRRKRKIQGSIVQTMGLIAPQIIANSGAPGWGYDAINPALAGDWRSVAYAVSANEIMLFTGWDSGGNAWRPQVPLMNYGLMFGLPWLLKKIFKSKYIDIPMLGKVKVI